MNYKYNLFSNILQELKFRRHRFFHPEKIALKSRKKLEQIKNRFKFQQQRSIQKSLTRASLEKLKRKPQGL